MRHCVGKSCFYRKLYTLKVHLLRANMSLIRNSQNANIAGILLYAVSRINSLPLGTI